MILFNIKQYKRCQELRGKKGFILIETLCQSEKSISDFQILSTLIGTGNRLSVVLVI